MTKPTLYKVIFHNAGKVYELYARQVGSGAILGFVEISGLVFGNEGLVVDPTEERLRQEFDGVRSLQLPMHSVVRIEEVERRGQLCIRDSASGEKIMPFPVPMPGK